MTAYEFLVEDILTGEIGELPLNEVTYEDYLNRPGKLDATLPLSVADANIDLLDAGRRAFYVLRDGNIDWGGLLLQPQVPLGSSVVKLTCLGWLAYWDGRDIYTDRQFTATDQFTIFKTLIDDAQDPAAPIQYDATGTSTGLLAGVGGDVGITVAWSALSGVLRDRLQEYRWFSGKNLGAALRDLAALENGFDFRMQYAINADGGKIDKSILLSYPQQGLDRSNEIGFEYIRGKETNILNRGLTRDASKMAWRMRGWGAGADVARLNTIRIQDANRGVYPFFDGQGSFSGVVVQGTLDDNTAAALATNDHVIEIPMLEVNPNRDPKWGTYGLGDTFNIDMDDGYCSAQGPHRIIGYKMNAATDRPTLYVQAA